VWYDQSGNGNHALQTDPQSQPLISQHGVVVTANAKPVIEFTTSDDSFEIPFLNASWFFLVGNVVATLQGDGSKGAKISSTGRFVDNLGLVGLGLDAAIRAGLRGSLKEALIFPSTLPLQQRQAFESLHRNQLNAP
jgi:hypothetical protein